MLNDEPEPVASTVTVPDGVPADVLPVLTLVPATKLLPAGTDETRLKPPVWLCGASALPVKVAVWVWLGISLVVIVWLVEPPVAETA